MYNVYLYLPETLADWEVGHITAELRSKRFFRADAPQVTLRTVGLTAESVLTMSGLRVVPDGTIDEIPITSETVLLLPGANTWNDPTHGTAVALAAVSDGSLITAGATGALMWTKQILERLDVFSPDTLRAWYDYFSTGEAQSFFALMQSLPSAR